MPQDIATSATRVGGALASVRLDQMILNLARGIAWGQFDLDQTGVDIAKMMGVPGTVSIDDENLSMLEAGFLPTFYQFVDSILEMKMDIKIREEQSSHTNVKEAVSRSREEERGGETYTKVTLKFMFGSYTKSQRSEWKTKTTSAYSRSMDTTFAQQFGQELSASSYMRTKVVPKPPPDLLIERIKIILEELRKQAEAEAVAEAENSEEEIDIAEMIELKLMEKIEREILGRVPEAAEGDEPAGAEGSS